MRVKSPAYLQALADVRAAKASHAAAQNRLDLAVYDNGKWTTDLAALKRSGQTIITADEAAQLGSGSGYEVLYHPSVDRPPHSDLDLARMADAITESGQKITYAEAVVTAMVADGTFDIDPWEGDHRYVWWPLTNTAPDWQGRPLTEADLAKLDHDDLRWHIQRGTIRERIGVTV